MRKPVDTAPVNKRAVALAANISMLRYGALAARLVRVAFLLVQFSDKIRLAGYYGPGRNLKNIIEIITTCGLT
jgi:hypothetical protein